MLGVPDTCPHHNSNPFLNCDGLCPHKPWAKINPLNCFLVKYLAIMVKKETNASSKYIVKLVIAVKYNISKNKTGKQQYKTLKSS